MIIFPGSWLRRLNEYPVTFLIPEDVDELVGEGELMMGGDDWAEFSGDGFVIEWGVFLECGGGGVYAEVVVLPRPDDAMGAHNE